MKWQQRRVADRAGAARENLESRLLHRGGMRPIREIARHWRTRHSIATGCHSTCQIALNMAYRRYYEHPKKLVRSNCNNFNPRARGRDAMPRAERLGVRHGDR